MAKILAESAFSCLLLLTSITAYCYSVNRRSKRLQNMEHCLEPMTEEEMYAIEFSPEELCEEQAAEEPETEYHCPMCHSTELQYAMHYRVSDDDETQELYRCARCGAIGEADDCRVELANPRRFTTRRTASSSTRSRFSGLATTIVSRVASA